MELISFVMSVASLLMMAIYLHFDKSEYVTLWGVCDRILIMENMENTKTLYKVTGY